MLTYRYTARNPDTGQNVKAIVQADSEAAAAKLIKQQGFTPIDISLDSKSGLGSITEHFNNHVRAKDRVLFARQLSTLINAGLPLVQALRSVDDQTTSKPLKIIISDVISEVEGGQQLSKALEKYPRVFNRIFLSLVAAGETSGTLDVALDRIALQQEKDADITSKIRGAMIYPLAVVGVMIAVVIFMLVKVLPQVQILYTSFPGASLPIETRVLLDLSHLITKYYVLGIIIIVILVLFITRFSRTSTGKHFFDTLKIDTPPFNTLFRKVYMARFSRTASTLVAAGVPLLQVLEITSLAVNNDLVQGSIRKAADKVKGGKSLGESLSGDPYFLPLVPNMLKIGEQSGSMEGMLAKTADYFEKEVDDTVKNISSIIEPVMMVLLGIVALIIVAAVLLPVYGLAGSGAISGGGT
jgi:type IV pilus assembly protein PilC